MREREISVGFDRVAQQSNGLFVLAEKELHGPCKTPPEIGGRIARAQPKRILDVTCSLFATANKILSQSDIRVGGGEIPVERERTLKFGNALRSAIREYLDDSQTQVRPCVLGRDRQSLIYLRAGEPAVYQRRPNDRIDIAGIERQSALEKLSGF